MKRRFAAVLLLAFTSYATADTRAKLTEVKLHKINNSVYALLAPVSLPNKDNRGYMSNSAIIIGDKGVILVDTGFSDEIGRHLKKAIAKITNKPITHIINTHDHGDHVLGNSEFKGAEIISSEKCKAVMMKSGYEWIQILELTTGYKFPGTKPVEANTGYAESTRTRVTIQGVDMLLWVPKGSHTANDMMVYLPKDKILIAGDVIVNEMIPSFRDAYVKTWIATLEEIMQTPVSDIIPGHGPLMKLGDVKKLHTLLKTLYAGIEAGYKKGLMDSEMRKILDLSEWKKMKHFDTLMGVNINRTYLEVEEANF